MIKLSTRFRKITARLFIFAFPFLPALAVPPDVQICLHPGEGAQLRQADGKEIPYTIMKKDKELTQIRFSGVYANHTIAFQVADKNRSFVFNPEAYRKVHGDGNPPLIQIPQENPCLDFSHTLATGKLPKSIRFTDENTIAVPLLYDAGVDMIQTHTGARHRLQVPARYTANKKFGFVETWIVPRSGQTELWVSQMSTGLVHVFNPETHAYMKTIPVKSSMPKILYSMDNSPYLYVTNWSGKNISVLSKDTYSFLWHLPALGHPRGIALSGDKKYLYIAQYGKNSDEDQKGKLVRFNMITKKFDGEAGTPGSQRHIVVDEERNIAFISNMAHSMVEVIDLNKFQSIAKIPVYHKPNTIVLSKDKKTLFVSCRGPNNPKGYTEPGLELGRLYFVNTSDFSVKGHIQGGNQPTGLDISPDNRYLASSDFLDNRIRIYKIKPGCGAQD